MFLLLAVLLLIFLPDPWNLALGLASLGLGAAEVVYWERRMRRHRVRTGVENLVGATGVVTMPLAPVGQIRVHGELWEARAGETLQAGERVRVTAVHDLTLDVEPATGGSAHAAGVGAVAVLALALALAACGGDDQSASEEYADSVCSTLSTWVTDVEETVRSVTDAGLAINREDIETAVDETTEATETLADDLRELGAPETEDGNETKSELDSLSTTLEQQVATVEEALESGGGVTAIAATVTAAISAAASAVNTTYQELQGLDPPGELSEAFEDSDECDSLREQLDGIGSGEDGN